MLHPLPAMLDWVDGTIRNIVALVLFFGPPLAVLWFFDRRERPGVDHALRHGLPEPKTAWPVRALQWGIAFAAFTIGGYLAKQIAHLP